MLLKGIAILIAFQLLGEWLNKITDIPIPGSVIGMLLLLACLVITKGKPTSVKLTSQTLLPYLPLLLTPACVGIMQHWNLLIDSFWPIVIALSTSFLAAFVITPMLLQKFLDNKSISNDGETP